MRRTPGSILIVVTLTLVVASSSFAQSMTLPRLDDQTAGAGPESGSAKATLLRVAAGALIGGGLGYFASQIAVSDWDRDTGAGAPTNRMVWAGGGIVAGAVFGRLLSPSPRSPGATASMTRGRAVLSYDEIARSGAINALELIRSQRPEWLVQRGGHSLSELTRSDDVIIVYLDNARIGGPQHLERIQLGNVERLEFIDPATASFRWGGGHAHGVILITTDANPGRWPARDGQRAVLNISEIPPARPPGNETPPIV